MLVIKSSQSDIVVIILLDLIKSLRLKGNSLAPRLSLFNENLVGSPVDCDAGVGHLIGESRDSERENFSREMGISVKVVGSGV